MKKIKEHFRKNDPLLYSYFEQVSISKLSPAEDLFEELCSSIVGQQLSGKAADTIFARFKKLFPKEKVTASQLVKIPDQKMRAAGCSWAKVASLKDLATKITEGKLTLKDFWSLPDEEVVQKLVTVRGIGPWTAEMFLMFALAREDVFSHSDLGLSKGLQKLYKISGSTDKKKAEKIVSKWKPYRTYAARVLWKSLEL